MYPVESDTMDATLAPTRDPPPPTIDGDLILREFLSALWRRRLLIFSVSAIFALAAGTASWVLPKKYEATLLLSAVVSQSNSGPLGSLGSTISQLGGIASLAGISMSGPGSAKAESLATLESEALTQQYIAQNNLLPLLFRTKWDDQQKKWKSTDPDRIPTLWKGNEYFKDKVRDVKESTRTGLVTLTITWTDPKLAATWANGLVKLTNDYLREKAIRESDRNIAYLNDQVNKTSDIGLRSSIYSLMESEIKKQMLARGSDEYALKVIDAAVAPEKASSPRPVLWILAAVAAGVLLSSMFIFVKFLIEAEPKKLNDLTNP
jgi:uncharacterized protein involved in exopolysaccharide biosynthesis